MKFLSILWLFLIACQPAKKNLHTRKEVNHEELITSQLGGEFEYEASEDGRYWLCKRTGNSPHTGQINFLVYDLANQKTIHQERLENGRVEWENNILIKITTGVGNRTKEHPEGFRIYYFDVKKEKIVNKIIRRD